MNSNDFLLTSDLATLKNDTSENVLTLTIPNGMTFNPGSNPLIASRSFEVGTINAGIRCVGSSSKYSGNSLGTTLITDMNMNISGVGSLPVTVYCTLVRTSANTLEIQAYVEGFAGSPNHTTLESQTITFRLSTFLSPFDN